MSLLIAYYLFAAFLILLVMVIIKWLARTPWRTEEGDETDQMGYEQDTLGKPYHAGLDTAGYPEEPE